MISISILKIVTALVLTQVHLENDCLHYKTFKFLYSILLASVCLERMHKWKTKIMGTAG